jgi:hypothetical protein
MLLNYGVWWFGESLANSEGPVETLLLGDDSVINLDAATNA